MEKFDYEKFLEGHPVITRAGIEPREAKVLSSLTKIVAVINDEIKIIGWNGRVSNDYESAEDLFMKNEIIVSVEAIKKLANEHHDQIIKLHEKLLEQVHKELNIKQGSVEDVDTK